MKKVNIKKCKRLIAWILIMITVVAQVNLPSISDIATLVYAKEAEENNELENSEISTEDITESSTEELEENQVCDVIGYAVYRGEDEFSLEDMELILCADGVDQLDIKPIFNITDELYEGFPMWRYSFSDLPQYDENEKLINYSIRSKYDYDNSTIYLNYILDGDVVAENNEICNVNSAILVWSRELKALESYIQKVDDYVAFQMLLYDNLDEGEEESEMIAGTLTASTFTVNWNDNDRGNRPDVDITIYYKIGNDEPAVLDEDVLLSWGMNEETIQTLLGSIDSVNNNTDNDNPNKKAYNNWVYTFSLPKELVSNKELEEGETPETKAITYSFKIKNQSELEEEYFVVYKDGKTVANTLKAVMEFNVVWKDGSNRYGTRISDILSNMVLYRKSTKSSSSAEENLGNSCLSIDDSNTNITTSQLAKYDSEGYPYEYYIKLEGNITSININGNSTLTDKDNLKYNITYTNIGNGTENTTACYVDGNIVYTLYGEVPLNITKEWLDDNKDSTIDERPEGTLYLYRYANILGRDYTKASPVAGMQATLDTRPENNATSYIVTFPNSQNIFPRFDESGNEYVYFIQEILDSNDKYEKVFTYSNSSDNKDKDATSIIFNGGKLQNRRRETISISATKEWKAQAMQDMTASVKLELQRRLVDDENAEFKKVFNEELDGFRAEEMSKTYVFGGLPQFDEKGLRYEYRVIETEVTINGSTVPISQNSWSEETIKPDDDGHIYKAAEQTCTIGGRTFVLSYVVDELGNTTLTNSLKGETEVWVKKIWTNNEVPSDSKDSTIGISVYNKTTNKLVGTGQITAEEAGAFVKIAGGLPQYDSEGREIPYYITEKTVSGYYNSIGYVTKDGVSEDGQQVNRVEATVTNTLATGGRSVEIRKEWYDDSDENCRGDVEVTLYHTTDDGESWEKVSSTTLTKARDWKAWISLSWEDEDEVRDENYSNYYVKETGIIRSVDGKKVTYKSDYASLEIYPDLDADPVLVGEVKTNMHYYDINASVDNGGSVYTFRNVRKGLVNVSLNKKWNDDRYQEDFAPQQVTFKVMRSTTYGEDEDTVDTIVLDGNIDEIETVQWSTTLEKLPKYNSEGILYKYWIEESIIEELDSTGKVISEGKHELDGDTSYVLSGSDSQRYTISIGTVASYGEHNGEAEPMADELTVTATNSREESIEFAVNKVWRDVTRDGDSRVRPDLYLTIYEQIGDGEPKDITKSVERVWNTKDEYRWICTFKDLPRYTSDGIEITYTVKENMPIAGEYKTVYYADEPVVVDDNEELSYILNNKNYYDIPDGATVLDGYVTNGGTIVNYREDYRYLTGSKIWLNVPNNMAGSNYPSITLTLEKEVFVRDTGEGESGYVPVKVEYNSRAVDVDLENGQKVFTFGHGENSIKLDKYDAYGTLIHYSVDETSEPILGYREPVYNPEKLMVTNACKTPDELDDSERAYVDVEKIWDMTDANVVDKLEPEVTLELWRVMTDGTGNILADTAENAGKSATVKYNSGKQKVSFGKTTEETVTGDTNKVEGKLAKYGYNGEIFYYYVREKVNNQYITTNVSKDGYSGISAYNIATPYYGYRVAITANDGDIDLDNKTANYFDYEITNHYTGENYITLSGTKYWAGDSANVFDTRPENITLNVYRQIDGDSDTLENITNKVDITWNKANINDWTYEVKVKAPCNDITLGKVGGTATLSRYATNGKKYIYYVEEVKSDKDNYNAEVVVGTLIKGIGTEGNLTVQGIQSSNGNITASFRNRMEYTDYTVNKIWKKQVDGLTSTLTKEEFDMMLPDNITITIEYFDGTTWKEYTYKNSNSSLGIVAGSIASKTISKSECKKLISNGEMSILFKELPKFDENEEEIIYRAVESRIGGIDVASNSAAGFDVGIVQEDDGVTTTITNTLQTIPLKITKKWDDNNNQDGVRPAELEFSIIRDEDESSPINITLNVTNKNQDEVETWESEVIYVPKYQADGVTLSVYIVRENLDDEGKSHYILETPISVEDRYAMKDPSSTTEADTDNPKIYAFVNMHGERLIDVTVTKKITDTSIGTTIGAANQNDIRPTSIQVALQRRADKNSPWVNMKFDQGESKWIETVTEDWQTIDLTGEANTWTYTWENLIARWNTDGTNLGMKYYEYQVIEKDMDAYTPTYKDDNSSVAASKTPVVITEQNCKINGDVNEGKVLLTNMLDTTTLYVEKTWSGVVGEFAKKYPVIVQLQYRLKSTGEEENVWVDGVAGATKTLNSGNSWKATFTDLPVENNLGIQYEYRIKEISINGTAYNSAIYQYSYKGSDTVNTTKDGKTTSTITNTLEKRTPITVTKNWDDDNNRDGIRPDSVTVILVKDGVATDKQGIVLNSTNNWTCTFDNLPRYKADGITPCAYTVEEVITDVTASAAYTIAYSVDGEDYVSTAPIITEIATNLDTETREVTIKNTYVPKTINIAVNKDWSDDYIDSTIGEGNRSGIRSDSIYVTLERRKNDTSEWKYMTVTDGAWSENTTAQLFEINSTTSWIKEFTNLTARWNVDGTRAGVTSYQYRIVEQDVTAYTANYRDNNNSIAANKTPVIITETDCKLNDITSKYEGSIDLTNELNTTTLYVEKAWSGAVGEFAKKYPVIVQLQYRLKSTGEEENVWIDGVAGATKTLNSGNSWKATFTDLPVENNLGIQYEYRIKEISINGTAYNSAIYQYSYSGAEATNVTDKDGKTTNTVTNTLEKRTPITVTKNWDDDNNRDGIRPDSVTVRLIKDGVATDKQEIILNSTNNWTCTFDNLPRYKADGITPCAYTVEEVITDVTASAAYTIAYSVDGEDYVSTAPIITEIATNLDTETREVTVKNIYVPKNMSIAATKVWEDYDNLYGTRLDSVTLLLKSTTNEDGITGATVVTGIDNPITINKPDNASDGWNGSWNNLPIKTNASGTSKTIYYSVVEIKAGGTDEIPPFSQYQSPTYDYTTTVNGGVMSKNSTEVSLYGSLDDEDGSIHNVEVTNTLDTVDVTANKMWEDYNNLYSSRPDSITFTLQQKVHGSSDDYQDATDNQGNILTKELLCGTSTSESQTVTFTGLPKYNAEGKIYEYRALETAYEDSDGIAQVTPNADDITKGSFKTHDFEYIYQTSVEGYKTAIANTLQLERIIISGEKSWEDSSNKYESRPRNIRLTVYYKNNINEATWTLYSLPYTINWDKTTKADTWTYSIEGLPKYVTGTQDTIVYCIVESDSTFYEQTLPVKNASDLNGSVVTVKTTDKAVSGVNFTNTLIANEKLVVSKSVDRGRTGDAFEFKVWVSDIPIDENNQGVLYTGDYEVYKMSDDIDSAVGESKNTNTGSISIEAGEKFLIKGLPNNYYYLVEEVEQEDYELMTPYNEREGQLGSDGSQISEVDITNHGYTKLAIGNDTNNQDSNNNTVYMGGKVVVITDLSTTPTQSEEDGYINDEVAVAWMPDLYWTFGDTFTIEYTTFDGLDGKIVITEYIDSDGNLKSLSECTVIEDTLGDLDKFIEDGASLSWYNETAIKLVVVENEVDMPYETKVMVTFVPTLAVNNITPNSIGGTVCVENGNASSVSDGINGDGNAVYPGATVVYGMADEGYQVNIQQLAVRNMNDADGNSVLLNVDVDGKFSVLLPTMLDGDSVNIQLTGHVEYVTEDGVVTEVKIILDELPIPLQFDILFVEIEEIPEEPIIEGPDEDVEPIDPSNLDGDSETIDANNNAINENKVEGVANARTSDNTQVLFALIIGVISLFMCVVLRKKRKINI